MIMIKKIMKRLLKRQDKNIVQAIQFLNVDSVFTDSFGNKHNVYNGLKDILKPGWKKNFRREFTFAIPGRRDIKAGLASSEHKLSMIKGLADSIGMDIKNKNILEIGCYSGTVSMLMSKYFSTQNICTDITHYYISQRGEQINREMEDEQDRYLQGLRHIYMDACDIDDKIVRFINDDICHSSLPEGIFDMIFSFETLEHVIDPQSAFAHMHALLKHNGIMIHHYNPFFSIAGGHSFATTNILWGHALLSSNDIETYFRQYEPKIKDRALSFMKSNLNRMTSSDLKRYTDDMFETLYFKGNAFYDYSGIMNREMPRMLKNVYAAAQRDDMLNDEVIFMLKKK